MENGSYTINGDVMYLPAGMDLSLNRDSIQDKKQPEWWRKLKSGAVKAVVVGEGITEIPELAFATLTSIERISLPETLTHIGDCAFSNCVNLSAIDIPNSVVCIGRCAFEGSGLEQIRIPASLQSIGAYAFQGCDQLKSAYIGAVEVIPEGMFSNCPNLDMINIDNGVQKIDDFAFEGTALEFVSIPKSVTSLGRYVFNDETVVLRCAPSEGAGV